MHPTDGMWQEVLDGESDPPVQRDLQNHLAACVDCQVKVSVLERQRSLVTGLLDRLDGEVPLRTLAAVLGRARPRVSRGMLAAAAIIICMVTAAGATVRTGLFHRATDWLLGPRPWLEASPAAPVPHQADAAAQGGIAFEPAGDVEVVFADAQPSGTIEVTLSPDSKVSITASAPVGYTVRKGRVAVVNQGGTASYRIVLPRSVPIASIRIANRLVFSKHGSTLTTETRADSAGAYLIPFSPKGRNSR